jgi:hypothetical protein
MGGDAFGGQNLGEQVEGLAPEAEMIAALAARRGVNGA